MMYQYILAPNKVLQVFWYIRFYFLLLRFLLYDSSVPEVVTPSPTKRISNYFSCPADSFQVHCYTSKGATSLSWRSLPLVCVVFISTLQDGLRLQKDNKDWTATFKFLLPCRNGFTFKSGTLLIFEASVAQDSKLWLLQDEKNSVLWDLRHLREASWTYLACLCYACWNCRNHTQTSKWLCLGKTTPIK